MSVITPDLELNHLGPPPAWRGYREGDGDGGLRSRLRRYRLALGVTLAAVLMMFISFSSAYLVRRGLPTRSLGSLQYAPSWERLALPTALLLVNSLLLVFASVTMEVARRRAAAIAFCELATQPRESPWNSLWLSCSLVLSLGFVAGQCFAWRVLRSENHFMTTGARSAFFYLLTGAHVIHVLLGIAILIFLAIRSRFAWRSGDRYVAVDVSAWYLHSMAALWIYLFAFLSFA